MAPPSAQTAVVLDAYDVDGARLPEVATSAGRATLLRDTTAADGWLLAVDDVPQSYVDLADPTRLEFAYVRLLGDLVDLSREGPLRVVHLGGGGATLARYVAATRPGSAQAVVEVDAALAALVADRLGTAGFRLLVGDARDTLALLPEGADLVVLDAFAGSAVPPHLTTAEHVDGVRRVLEHGGTYAVNVPDGGALDYSRAVSATLAGRFEATAVLAAPAVLRGRRFGNVVVVASDADLPVAELTRRAAGRADDPVRVVSGTALEEWLGDAEPLTDASPRHSPEPPSGVFTLSGPRVAARES